MVGQSISQNHSGCSGQVSPRGTAELILRRFITCDSGAAVRVDRVDDRWQTDSSCFRDCIFSVGLPAEDGVEPRVKYGV